MAIYDPKSLRAEEFINDGEILETLAYADAHKNDLELIDSILEKARPKKNGSYVTCAGLSHREASVLLACEIPEKIDKADSQQIQVALNQSALFPLSKNICKKNNQIIKNKNPKPSIFTPF